MTKETATLLVKKLDNLYELDRSIREATKIYYSIMAPDSHAPILEVSEVDGALEAIKIILPDLHEYFEYYIYEAKNMKDSATYSFEDGRKYDCTKQDEFIQLIYDETRRKETTK